MRTSRSGSSPRAITSPAVHTAYRTREFGCERSFRTPHPAPPFAASARPRSRGHTNRRWMMGLAGWTSIGSRCGSAIWPARARRLCPTTRRPTASGRSPYGKRRPRSAGTHRFPPATPAPPLGEGRLGDSEMSLTDLLRARFGTVRGEVIGVGSMRREFRPDHPLGETASFYEFSCTASEVAVDQETGEILLVRHVTVADVGKAINPLQVEGQDEGAAVMGLGHTLMEQLIL